MPDDNNLITSVEDLEAKVPLDDAGEVEPEASEEVNQEDTASEEGSTEEVADATEAVEVDDEPQFSEEELQETLALGARIREYQRTHPGYDPIGIHKDYTQKSMELAELKRASKTREPEPAAEPAIDLEGIAPEDITLVEKILKAKGYVHQSDLQKQNYEQVKKQEINNFLEQHPEYRPQNDPGDSKWNALLQEFNLYKLPQDPKKIGSILKRAHANASGSQIAIDPKAAAKMLAQKRVNKTNQATGSGKSGEGKKAATGGIPELARQHLKGVSEEQLAELFKD